MPMDSHTTELPFDLKKVYGEHPVRSETFELGMELRESPSTNSLQVRLLTDFLFVKNGKLVYPHAENCTEDFWLGLELWGFMMSPSGPHRWLAWSLHWHLDWPGKNLELVRICDIDGISKEAHRHYRNGNEVALWVNTSRQYAYALMEPEEQIAHQWSLVRESWRNQGPKKLPVPICGPATSLVQMPDWWHHRGQAAGKKDWAWFVINQTAHLKTLEGDQGEVQSRMRQPQTQQGNSKTAGSRKRKAGNRALGRTGAQTGPGIQEVEAIPGEVADNLELMKSPAKAANIPISYPGPWSPGDTPLPLPTGDTSPIRSPPPKRSRVALTPEWVPLDFFTAMASPGKQNL